MSDFISLNMVSDAFSSCLNTGLINQTEDTSIVFYDFNQLQTRVNLLQQSFPENTLHTAAIKANPLFKVSQKLNDLGLGAEVASEGEIYIAQRSGFSNHKIVFDSPVKTHHEIAFALKNNIHINADSLMELDRIDQLKKTIPSDSKIGLRINPQVGVGTIEATSVAGEYSKFGIPLKSHRLDILNYFKKYSWLTGIHIHIGSQACEMKMLLNGFEIALQLINEINQNLQSQNREIQFVDIGGGLPISYHHNIGPPSILEYGKHIKALLKKYDLNKPQLITEFGRFLHANCGFIVSKIEYVKHYQNSNTLMIHSGADILLRECLNPGNWYHEISILNEKGEIKNSDNKLKYHIAGPLCFAGDIVARNIELPKASEGDYIVIHDTGGYTFGMWSKYVSRLFPKVIGIENNQFEIIRKRETIEDIFKFWT